MEQKKRQLRFKDPEFRAMTEPDGVRRIRGYPVIFNVAGQPYWQSDWTEIIDPGALADVDLSNLYVFIEHSATMILAKYGVNLRAEVDNIGLFIEATLGDTSIDDYAFDRVSRGILEGMSFSFFADKITTDSTAQQDRVMHITDILEVSLVAFPAYEASVAIATQTSSGSSSGQQDDDPDEVAIAAAAREKAAAALDLELALIG